MKHTGAGQLENLLDRGWSCHHDESELIARELEAVATDEIPDDTVAPFIHLSTHTIGEHLGDWARALKLGKRALDGRAPTAETARAWGRLYVAAVLAEDFFHAIDLEFSYLRAAGDDFGPALLDMRFMLAEALVSANRPSEAARLYRNAIDLVDRIAQSPPLDRTIAVASNNLGWELYEMAARTAEEDTLMVLCAEMSLKFWRRCGTWINEERALYLNAVVANATGDPASGLKSADAALAIIAANGERPLDAAPLLLARAVSLTALGNDGASSAIQVGGSPPRHTR